MHLESAETVDLSSAFVGFLCLMQTDKDEDWNGYVSWELGHGKNYAVVDADVVVVSESFFVVNMTI